MVTGLLLAATLVLARRPYYNWDMFPYMAIVMASPDIPFEQTHARVYEEARANMLPGDFEAIASRQPELKADPQAFQDILRYHTLKPGYTGIARILYHLGVNPLAATWLPSLVSYFLLGILIFSWAKMQAPVPAAALFTFVITLSPPMMDLARYSSPDMLGALLSLAGLVLILQNNTTWGTALLTMAILVRPDAILILAPVAIVLAWTRKLSVGLAIVWLAAGLGLTAYLFSDFRVAGEYTFAEANLSERMHLYRDGLTSLLSSYTIPLVVVGCFTLLLRRKSDLLSLLVWAALFSIAVRYLLHPFVEDRFHLPAYLIILLATWQTVSLRVFKPGESKS